MSHELEVVDICNSMETLVKSLIHRDLYSQVSKDSRIALQVSDILRAYNEQTVVNIHELESNKKLSLSILKSMWSDNEVDCVCILEPVDTDLELSMITPIGTYYTTAPIHNDGRGRYIDRFDAWSEYSGPLNDTIKSIFDHKMFN